MPLFDPSDVIKSLQDKILPGVLSSIGLALISPVTKKIKDIWLGDRRKTAYKKLSELNSGSREIRLACGNSSEIRRDPLMEILAKRKKDLLSEIYKIEVASEATRLSNQSRIGLVQRLLLLTKPDSIFGWLLRFEFYFYLLFTIYLVFRFSKVLAYITHVAHWRLPLGYWLVYGFYPLSFYGSIGFCLLLISATFHAKLRQRIRSFFFLSPYVLMLVSFWFMSFSANKLILFLIAAQATFIGFYLAEREAIASTNG